MAESNAQENAGEQAGQPAPGGGAGEQPPAKNKVLRSVIFLGVLIGVVVAFQLMYVFQVPPPDMPEDELHTLRFNTSSELIGVGDMDQWPTKDGEGNPLPMGKKAIERRVNIRCATCHGAPSGLRDEEFSAMTACAVPDKCLPKHDKHPPKATCIKCHRMPGAE